MRVEVDFSGDSAEGRAAIESIERGFVDLLKQALETGAGLDRVRITTGQVTETVAGAHRMKAGIAEVGQEARQTTRDIERMRLATYGSGLFGGLLPGGARPRTMALGALGLLGAAVSGPTGGAAIAGLAALPALAGAGGAAIGVLVGAFSGLDKALAGDRQEFEKLTPTAQAFVQELRSLQPWVEGLQDTARKGLFPGVTAGLREALTPANAKAIEDATRGYAQALGEVGEQWGRSIGSPGFTKGFRELGEHGATWMTQLGDATDHFATGLGHIAIEGLPLADWLVRVTDQGAKLFDEWIRGQQASGELAAGLGSARHELEIVARFLFEVGDAAVALAFALTPLGNEILVDLTGALHDLADWLDKNRAEVNALALGALHALEGALRIVSGLIGDVTGLLGGWQNTLELAATAFIGFKVVALATMAAIRVDAALTAGTLRAALIGSGIGLVVVAFGVAAEQIIRHWDTVRNALIGVAHDVREVWLDFVLGLKIIGLQAALAVLEPFSHMPERLGGWARDAKVALVAQLDELAVAAGQRGAYAGDLFGRNFYDNVSAWADAVAKVTAATGPASTSGGNLVASSGAAPRSFANRVAHPTAGLGVLQQALALQGVTANPSIDYGGHGKRTGLSYHYAGEALDIGGSPAQLEQVWAWLKARRNNFAELFYRGEAYHWGKSGAAVAGHNDHIHVSFTGTVEEASQVIVNAQAKAATVKKPVAPKPAATPSAAPGGVSPFGTPPAWDPGKTTTPKAWALPYRLQLALAEAAVTPGQRDDLTAARTAARWVKAAIPGLSGQDKLSALNELRALQTEIASILKGFADTAAKAAAKAAAAVKAHKAAFADAWKDLAAKALDAFDAETQKHRTPSEILLGALTGEHESAARQARLDDANKQLAAALQGHVEDAAGIVDRARQQIGRTLLTNAIDAVQAQILGGPASPISAETLLGDLQRTLAGGNVVDPDEVKRAQQAVEDAKYEIKVAGLEESAQAERDAYAQERAELRDHLVEIGAAWEEWFGILKGRIASIPGAWDAALRAMGLETVANAVSGPGVGAAQTGNAAWDARIYQALGRKGEVGFFAQGGIATKPTRGVFGEAGREALIPLDSPAGRAALGVGDVTVVLEGDLAALGDFVRVKAVEASGELALAQGRDADTRLREGRFR